MSKQDRQGVRTAADIERKYELGDITKQEAKFASQSERISQLAQAIAKTTGDINELQRLVDANKSNIEKNASAITKKVDNAGWAADKYLATDDKGNVVAKDKPKYTAKEIAFNNEQTVEDVLNGMLGKVYPVGAVYISISTTEPATLFGGEWERFAQGKLLMGVPTAAEGTEEEPAGIAGTIDVMAATEGAVSIPYITCYMWKRIK